VSLEVRQSSGHDLFDSVALNAVWQANPFEALPAEMGREELPICASFVYTLKRPTPKSE